MKSCMRKGGATQGNDDGSRREALIKIGKYAAYTPPAMVVTLSAARGATVSGAPSPSAILLLLPLAPTPTPSSYSYP